jgi:hypothetical protein
VVLEGEMRGEVRRVDVKLFWLRCGARVAGIMREGGVYSGWRRGLGFALEMGGVPDCAVAPLWPRCGAVGPAACLSGPKSRPP